MWFTSQKLGTLSPPQTVVVTNTGHSSLHIQRVHMTGADLNDFLISSDDCSYVTLLVGESCSISVRFAPSASKQRSATLSVHSTDPFSPLKIAMFGIGGRTSKAIRCAKPISKTKRGKHTRANCPTKHHTRRRATGHTGRRHPAR